MSRKKPADISDDSEHSESDSSKKDSASGSDNEEAIEEDDEDDLTGLESASVRERLASEVSVLLNYICYLLTFAYYLVAA